MYVCRYCTVHQYGTALRRLGRSPAGHNHLEVFLRTMDMASKEYAVLPQDESGEAQKDILSNGLVQTQKNWFRVAILLLAALLASLSLNLLFVFQWSHRPC